MILIGLDFDNTIIRYDELFYKVALEKRIIPPTLSIQKNSIKDYLIKKGQENEWTLIQGEVYGNRITEALPFEGMFKALKILQSNGFFTVLISQNSFCFLNQLAIFLKNIGSKNEPFAFGGIDDTRFSVRAVILSDNAFNLDAVCSILKDCARDIVPIIENTE